jgi:hypothetical protein
MIKACVIRGYNPKVTWMNAEAMAKGASAWYDSKDEGRNQPKGEKTTSSVGTMLRRRRSGRKKQLRLKLSACDDRRFLFMKLRNYKPT